MKNVTVTKIVEFEAAHFLPGYDGPCKNMHGHTYKVEIEAKRCEEGHENYEGMVIDFSSLKYCIKVFVLDNFDHTLLNNIITVPTAENLTKWIATQMNTALGLRNKYGVEIIRVRVWETSNSYAEWRA